MNTVTEHEDRVSMSASAKEVSPDVIVHPRLRLHQNDDPDSSGDLQKQVMQLEKRLEEVETISEQQMETNVLLYCELLRIRESVRHTNLRLTVPRRWDLIQSNLGFLKRLSGKGQLRPRNIAAACLRVLRRVERRRLLPGATRVCFLGDGVSGSWRMRSQQVARMRPDWTSLATSKISDELILRNDVFVFVKRFDKHLAYRLRTLGKIVIYDIVDPWKQPEDGLSYTTLPEIHTYFIRMLENLPVDGVIFPNRAMFDDLGDITPNPITIYHHSRLELTPVPIQRVAMIVGYEGREQYLGEWHGVIDKVCHQLGLQFVINPSTLKIIDIGFIARGGVHGSLMAKRYKSNVKLANMLAAGKPTVVQAGEAPYAETGGDLVRYFSNAEDLEQAIRQLLPYSVRQQIHQKMIPHSLQFHLNHITDQYESYFRALLDRRDSLELTHCMENKSAA